MGRRESLLDTLASRMSCTFLSDLCFLEQRERVHLGRIIRSIPLEETDLAQWNDALQYLAGCGPEKTREEARDRLLERLLETEVRDDDSLSKGEFMKKQ